MKMTQEEYDALLKEGQGLCAICDRPLEHRQPPYVHPSYATGQIRGLLCKDCTMGLEAFQDSPLRLAKGIKYLT
jgi:hypothetical protein